MYYSIVAKNSLTNNGGLYVQDTKKRYYGVREHSFTELKEHTYSYVPALSTGIGDILNHASTCLGIHVPRAFRYEALFCFLQLFISNMTCFHIQLNFCATFF